MSGNAVASAAYFTFYILPFKSLRVFLRQSTRRGRVLTSRGQIKDLAIAYK